MANNQEKLLRVSEVLEIIHVSRSCWLGWVKSNRAPQPIRFGRRCSRWKQSAISEFIAREELL
ncbi:helix-turn-helix transcriptional regulator [Geotalea uraniireducens]|uniref:helix-turn-helix transcriptional regulator n=1 Tax=Geotalea uraniireducens TaxID=351604 RepID=UPI0032B50830